MKLYSAVALLAYALGYWLAWTYAPEPTSRVSNGLHPLSLLGGLLEVMAGAVLLVALAKTYTQWAWVKPRRSQGWLLIAWLALLLVAALLYQGQLMAYTQALAPMGSTLRFYLVTPWPVLLVVCLLGTWLSYRGWKETRTG